MRKNLKAKSLESLSSVLPITAIVLALSFTLAPDMPAGTLMMFLLGAILLIVGMGFFSLGADMAMMPMGDGVGGEVVRLSKRCCPSSPWCSSSGPSSPCRSRTCRCWPTKSPPSPIW